MIENNPYRIKKRENAKNTRKEIRLEEHDRQNNPNPNLSLHQINDRKEEKIMEVIQYCDDAVDVNEVRILLIANRWDSQAVIKDIIEKARAQ